MESRFVKHTETGVWTFVPVRIASFKSSPSIYNLFDRAVAFHQSNAKFSAAGAATIQDF